MCTQCREIDTRAPRGTGERTCGWDLPWRAQPTSPGPSSLPSTKTPGLEVSKSSFTLLSPRGGIQQTIKASVAGTSDPHVLKGRLREQV